MKIDVGAGTLLHPGWIALDPVHGEGEWKRYAQDTPWPCADNAVEALRASHVMEHVPAGADRLAVMNEAHRVLAPGGTFEIIVPFVCSRPIPHAQQLVDGAPLAWQAIADPTHVSLWVPESFYYFDGTFAANADYGIALWETIELRTELGWEGHWIGTPRK